VNETTKQAIAMMDMMVAMDNVTAEHAILFD